LFEVIISKAVPNRPHTCKLAATSDSCRSRNVTFTYELPHSCHGIIIAMKNWASKQAKVFQETNYQFRERDKMLQLTG
jgi:hypothetical protein